MTWSGWRHVAAIGILLSFFLGCALPASPQNPLTAKAAKDTLDSWNPSYCKVVEFFGFHKSGEGGDCQVAYVLLANPTDKTQKPLVFVARFRLLNLPDGQTRWFLTSLVTPSEGLSRRQGWDNLLVPVKNQG